MKKFLKVAAFVMSAAFVMMVMACPQNDPTPTPNPTPGPETVAVTGMSLDQENLSLTTGESVTLVVTIEPDNATNKAVTWTSDDEGVAMVAQDGKVTAQGPGDTLIRVKTADGDFEATCSVKVTEPVGVEGISLNRTSFTIRINGTETLVATITPTDATNKDVIWRSDNDDVASVEHDGTVTAVADGTTSITVTTVDGDYEATCTVTVKTPEDLDTIGTYTPLPTNTDGTAGTSGTYVTFGTWPQTIKKNDVTVDEIKANKLVVGGSVVRPTFTYYMGSDGAWYCKQGERAYGDGDQYKYSDNTQVGKAQPGTPVTYKWFKVEPIKWRVLNASNSRAQSTPKFLLAESGIYKMAYYDGPTTRTVAVNGSNTTIYDNNYYHSTIRAWLNGIRYESGRPGGKGGTAYNDVYDGSGFLQTAFTTSQQDAINDTTVDNSAASTNPNGASQTWNSGTNTYACANTTDKVFLLSESEVTTSSYGFGAYNAADTARVRKASDFALALGAEKSSGGGSKWWLRSPYCDYTTLARRVVTDGNTDPRIMQTIGEGVDDSYKVSFNAVVVVPALYVNPQ